MGELAGEVSLPLPGPALQRSICKGWACPLLGCPSLVWGSAQHTLSTGNLSWKSLCLLRCLAGELSFLEISFSCLSFTFICLPPLRSAACQGRVTKGWVEKNDSTNLAACGAKRREVTREQEGHGYSWGLQG